MQRDADITCSPIFSWKHIWEEEVVEVFLQADPQQTSYIELEVNPLGTMLDIYLLDIRKPLHYESWNSQKLKWGDTAGRNGGREGWRQGVDVRDSPPNGRYCDRQKSSASSRGSLEVESIQSGEAAGTGVAGVSPTLKDDFHLPGMFGEIVFSMRLTRRRLTRFGPRVPAQCGEDVKKLLSRCEPDIDLCEVFRSSHCEGFTTAMGTSWNCSLLVRARFILPATAGSKRCHCYVWLAKVKFL